MNIEPGCMAVIFNAPGNNGEVVTALKKLTTEEAVAEFLVPIYTWWEIDKKVTRIFLTGEISSSMPFAPEHQLLRIDPSPEITEEEYNEVLKA